MPADEQRKDQPPVFDLQRMTDRLEGVGAKLDCPSCRTDSGWWVYTPSKEEPDSAVVRLPLNHPTISKAPTHEILAFALSCKKCGFLRLHDATILEGKIDG